MLHGSELSTYTQTPRRTPNRDKFVAELLHVIIHGHPQDTGDKQTTFITQRLENALTFAVECHGTTRRRSGDAYMCHIEDVVRRYIEIRTSCGKTVHVNDVIDLILHDTIEDYPHKEHKFQKQFGNQALERQKKLSKVSHTDIQKINKPFSAQWTTCLTPIHTVILDQFPTIFKCLYAFCLSNYNDTQALIEFTTGMQILGYDEDTFEKKCADQISNLEDTRDVEVLLSDTLETIESKQERNNRIITFAKLVYITKAQSLKREDLVKHIEIGITKREKIALELIRRKSELRYATTLVSSSFSPSKSATMHENVQV